MAVSLDLVVFGLSVTSSWGNGHATTYRALLRALRQRGHRITFFERSVPWYRDHCDLPRPSFCDVVLYEDLDQLRRQYSRRLAEADLVMVGSYVPQGTEVGRWVCDHAGQTAFYDIDTPVTLRQLEEGGCFYLHPDLIRRYRVYLSFTGGPTLRRLEQVYGSPCARPLYCCVDPALYAPQEIEPLYDLGYMGTYSADRQPALDLLLVQPAQRWSEGRFVVAGPQYPASVQWPPNVLRIDHLPPSEHRRFYNSQRFTLNVTRLDMCEAGYSPSVRLFEAAACGTAIISDLWPGLGTLFDPASEILVSRSTEQTLAYLRDLGEEERRTVARRGRERVLASHTSAHRALEFEQYAAEAARRPPALKGC
jgi:spore maturation protein CgeB